MKEHSTFVYLVIAVTCAAFVYLLVTSTLLPVPLKQALRPVPEPADPYVERDIPLFSDAQRDRDGLFRTDCFKCHGPVLWSPPAAPPQSSAPRPR